MCSKAPWISLGPLSSSEGLNPVITSHHIEITRESSRERRKSNRLVFYSSVNIPDSSCNFFVLPHPILSVYFKTEPFMTG